jgi:mono/diheme cytochrome c family protein
MMKEVFMNFKELLGMGRFLLGALLYLGLHQILVSGARARDAAASTEATQSHAHERQNPIKPTLENLAEAKKFFGYDCAMCHGATGDGKGEIVASMGLKMSDWRDSAALEAMSDGEIFDTIVKGKGKMMGEGERASSELVWELVNYVRSIAKKETAAVPKIGVS